VVSAPEGMLVRVLANGPYLVSGAVPVAVQIIGADARGDSVEWIEGRRFDDQERYALCRCGHSSNKPFCDGTHKKIGFEGTETADRRPYLEVAAEFDGPVLAVTDAQHLCVGARFCHPAAGRIWDLVGESGGEARRLAKREAGLCPSGRLVVWDRLARTAFEPELEQSIGIVEDPRGAVSGPIWVRGGITVQSAAGDVYETRNRVTLCRCGESTNKPFCDGAHARIRFDDGLLSPAAAS
jgi:CDGSH-type Zn-finger protein